MQVHLHMDLYFDKYLYSLWSAVGGMYVQRADRMHWHMPLYAGDLRIPGLSGLWGSWNQSPAGTKGSLFGGIKSCMRIFDYMGVSAPNPCIIQRSSVISLLWLKNNKYYRKSIVFVCVYYTQPLYQIILPIILDLSKNVLFSSIQYNYQIKGIVSFF